MNRYRRPLTAWIALVAMALQALWPLLAQAKPAEPGLRVAVCTVGGITHYIELERGRTPLEQRSAAQHEHCKMCLSGGDRAAILPPVVPAASVDAAASPKAVEAPIAQFAASNPYPSAQPRAPPLSL